MALPEQAHADAERFGLHPALLDAALHTVKLGEFVSDVQPGTPSLPFSWSGVVLHAFGADTLRVRTSPARNGVRDAVSLTVADATGAPVAEVGALALRTRRAVASRTGSAIGRLLPIASAGAIAGLGLLLSAGALLHL